MYTLWRMPVIDLGVQICSVCKACCIMAVQLLEMNHTWDHSKKIVPAAPHTASMLLDQLTHGDAQLLLDCHRVVHMPADAEELGAVVVLAAKARKPLRASPQDGWSDSHCFDISHGGRTAPEADIGWEGWLEPWLPLLALQALDQCCLLACTPTNGMWDLPNVLWLCKGE